MYTTKNSVENIFDWKQYSIPDRAADIPRNITNENLMILVSNVILQLGIPVNIKGYIYLREAIIIKVNDRQLDTPVTKILYPSVAKKFHTSAGRVERAIRHAIETAWNRAEFSSHDKPLSYPFSLFDRRPTNSEFIAMIADRIILLYD